MTVSSPDGSFFERNGLENARDGPLQTITSDRLPNARIIDASGMDPEKLKQQLTESNVEPGRACKLDAPRRPSPHLQLCRGC